MGLESNQFAQTGIPRGTRDPDGSPDKSDRTVGILVLTEMFFDDWIRNP